MHKKLIVMIPAYNERETIGEVIRKIPRKILPFETLEILVIDDGSRDGTVQVARDAGANHVISHDINRGLATTFNTGLQTAIKLGADVIVNIDADGQYDSSEIGNLVKPILEKKAEIVIGDRQVRGLIFMSAVKKYGNILGSFLIRKLSGADVTDASSGFRAFSREAALRLNVFTTVTYTHETIIDAASKGIKIGEVDIKFLQTKRPGGKSRLISNVFQHIKNSFMMIVRTYILYKPLKAFFYLGSTFILAGAILGVRFLYFYITVGGQGKIQSLILVAVLAIVGFQIVMMGFLADASHINRKVSEELLYREKAKNIDQA
ncbi:MAG: glycosyltransferase family 2 protein [Candidatus Doudnabacteria bacterium CG10_big_fil_rev_8_21_14_0_10_41_10]|uniref:Glycosyltransferase family 2 protein n=1 Tax=Candidatus Doudnabacteria bacterium CG10_big_fil_rev_8_21_14_0_10_41_10 TaxID=1974551 RepID=A0A2H0VEN0_9BACT|nr:MAG: glycosyltransferase family 2 protein [Candidatus Doudnabacteria bacterium CG10_big_fil_rev_8_21_14_0_10_41_10]